MVYSFTWFSYFVVSRNIPTSFESPLGYVLHKLQLELKRRMRLTIRIATVLNFVCKPYVDITRLMVWYRWWMSDELCVCVCVMLRVCVLSGPSTGQHNKDFQIWLWACSDGFFHSSSGMQARWEDVWIMLAVFLLITQKVQTSVMIECFICS